MPTSVVSQRHPALKAFFVYVGTYYTLSRRAGAFMVVFKEQTPSLSLHGTLKFRLLELSLFSKSSFQQEQVKKRFPGSPPAFAGEQPLSIYAYHLASHPVFITLFPIFQTRGQTLYGIPLACITNAEKALYEEIFEPVFRILLVFSAELSER